MGMSPPAFRGAWPAHNQDSALRPGRRPFPGRDTLWLLLMGGVGGVRGGASSSGGGEQLRLGERVLDKQERGESWRVVIFPIETKRALFLPNGKKMCHTRTQFCFQEVEQLWKVLSGAMVVLARLQPGCEGTSALL